MAKQLTKAEIEELQEVFNDFDADASGSVNVSELKSMLQALGQNVSQRELKELMDEVDADGSGEISFDEFCEMMAKKISEQGEVDIETQLQEIFRMFDRKEQGYVTFNDLKQILKMLSIKLPDEKVREMMVEASSAGDDRVTFDDFRYMYFC
ncbi:neo-calmodulin-like [Convolutriloba macropyga]|uniref:neo-calmodulin-like n=1 Tax=Convolutriloba macropyga TaxID=536237 RepID=UPI003F524EB8